MLMEPPLAAAPHHLFKGGHVEQLERRGPVLEYAGVDYEHTLSLELACRPFQLHYHRGTAAEISERMITGRSLDACEFSLVKYLLMRGRGEDWLTALPIFPNRNFRHGALHVRADGSLDDPRQLAGRRLGLDDYTQASAVWLRGLLLDEYQLDWRDVNWVCRRHVQGFPPPPEAHVSYVDKDAEELLATRRIDAALCFAPQDHRRPPGQRRLRPLIPAVAQAERDYFQRTGISPISRVVVVKTELLERMPGLGLALCHGFSAAKAAAFERQLGTTMLPWSRAQWCEALDLFDGDPLPYGLTARNRLALDKAVAYLLEQQLMGDCPAVDQLFAAECRDYKEKKPA
jgi:4,5-dihydroxyphthalate decarboxylase